MNTMNPMNRTCLLLLVAVACRPPASPKPAANLVAGQYADIVPASDTLRATPNEYGESCAYVDAAGAVVIPRGTFESCFSETFKTFAYVADKRFGRKIVAVNRNREPVFEAYLFDNGPDYPSDGLFRIKRNEKIGYADVTGRVVIAAAYAGAEPFEDGAARVTLDCELVADGEYSVAKSDQWFSIDKTGNKLP
jgi:hypothetical protein